MSEENFERFMDAIEEDDGPDSITPICCANPGCDNEVMVYNITWGYHECPICKKRVYYYEVDDYLQRVINGEFDE